MNNNFIWTVFTKEQREIAKKFLKRGKKIKVTKSDTLIQTYWVVDGRTYLETESLLEAPEDDYKVTWQRGT